MGAILNSRVVKDKIVFSVCVEQEEALQLKGNVKDIHIFSERIADIRTNLSGRGKNSATKYFLIPRELRKNIKFPQTKQISCQKIDAKEHVIFIYLVNKIPYKKILD